MTAPLTPSRRSDGWTLARQRDFLTHLAQFGGVAAAAKAVGLAPKSAYRLRHRDPAFAAAWDGAIEEGRLRTFDRAMDRAVNGYTIPVFRNGRPAGTRHRFDNRLAFAVCYARPMPRI